MVSLWFQDEAVTTQPFAVTATATLLGPHCETSSDFDERLGASLLSRERYMI
jgi:hypothetical protein